MDARTGCLIASWMRLDNREDLAAEFRWTPERTRSATDPEFLAEAWDRWGTDCADRLEGDFAFAIWDPRSSELFVARDSAGIKPLYYAETQNAFVVSTTAATFRSVPGVDVSPSREWMGLYLEGQSMDWETTALTGVRKLPPAHWLRVSDPPFPRQRCRSSSTPSSTGLSRHAVTSTCAWRPCRLQTGNPGRIQSCASCSPEWLGDSWCFWTN